MAITKILARKARLDVGIRYVLNGDKTDDKILTAHQNCDPGLEYREMLATKRAVGKEGGVQYYHMIQSFQPGEVTPELALSIAKEFAREHLSGYEVVIGTHVDRGHIHSHLLFNSVSVETGEKYHSNARSYYQKIRAVSDRLCQEHDLSIVLEGQGPRSLSYIEWLRQSKEQPTFRSMLEVDLREAIQDANDLGHFFLLMEHRGYEIRHGNRLGFRLRGQERFQYPGRRDARFSEEGIRAAIQGNWEEIEAGRRPAVIKRPKYTPYQKHPKYTGLLALYVHYLYLLGKIEQRQYPPRMTAHLKKEVMQFTHYQQAFDFLRTNQISTPEELSDFQSRTEDALAKQMKQRTILSVQRKKKQALYSALADAEALAPTKQLYEAGVSGMEVEFARYLAAVEQLERCDVPKAQLLTEKIALYDRLAEVNREIRSLRRTVQLCQEIQNRIPQMERDVQRTEGISKEGRTHERRRR